MIPAERTADAAAWLARAQARGATPEEALATWDALPPVEVPSLLGRWRGSGLPTGHPWDGVLERLGWWGKAFLEGERAHPLLFEGRGGQVVALEPRWFPVRRLARLERLPPIPRTPFALARPLLVTRRPAARLRAIEHRGRVSAAMVYDHLPIVDHFRRVDDDTLLGLMDLEGQRQPFLFVLRRAS